MGKRQRKGVSTEPTVIHSEQLFGDPHIDAPKTPLKAHTAAQERYMATIEAKDIIFATGPAGTGKTFVAVGKACEALTSKRIERIIVTRPVVPCDEDLGLLPGELDEKFMPWLAPLTEAFERHMGSGSFKYALKHKYIDAQPLMLMRGKTFHQSWMLLDEAQNTSPSQMKMFLTRMGRGSKVVVTGDGSQHDRYDNKGNPLPNGLADALSRLECLPEVGFNKFTRSDQVRHKLVGKILDCYE